MNIKGGRNMNLIIKDRGTGKTTGLIYTSEATGYPIVTSSNVQSHYIKDEAEKMGCVIPDPLTVEDLLYRNALLPDSNILFDNVESILGVALNKYLNANVVCATMTDATKYNHDRKKESEENSFIATEVYE